MRHLIIIMLATVALNLAAQNQASTAGPSSYGSVTDVRYVPSIAEQLKLGTFQAAVDFSSPQEVNPKRRGSNINVPGKGLPTGADPLVGLQRNTTSYRASQPLLVFDANVNSNSTPTDPTGAVGPNHYIGAWNSGFRIFDKAGNPLTPQASLASVITGNNLGDPIILYDKWADRFIITQFDNNPNGFEMAVCQGPDPVNDGWYVYRNQFTSDAFPDYTKFSIWADGYYVTANVNNGANGDRIWAVEREPMLDGLATQYVGFPLIGIQTSGFYSPQIFNVCGGDLPAYGTPATVVYMQDDSWDNVSTDHLKTWNVSVDWDSPNSSTIVSLPQISTAAFRSVFDGGAWTNLTQPNGVSIDALQATIMNQAQFRKFPTHNSAIFNFVVDTQAGSGKLAGVRWYELRQDGDGMPWSIYQEGTYVSPVGGKHAWAASMAMDALGNIGMAYSTVSTSQSIAIQHTGRFANDPLNTMTIDETMLVQGSSDNPAIRYADYVHLTLDPVDERTFWHIAEYFNPGRSDVVSVFRVAPVLSNDVGVISIDSPTNSTLDETTAVSITARNFGNVAQSAIPVSVSVAGGQTINGIIEGPIAPGENIQYTFTNTLDLSTTGVEYTLTATTALDIDEDIINNPHTSVVTNLPANDLGVFAILEPTLDSDDPDFEEVVVIIKNYGGEAKSNFEVSFAVNGFTEATEIVPGPLAPDSQMEYEFSAEANLNDIGVFELSVFTALPGDVTTENDEVSAIITKTICQPESNCNSGDGLRLVQISNLSNSSDCSDSGYSDFTDLTANLEQGQTYDLTINTERGNQFLRAWIDYNDSFTFASSETIVTNYEIAPGQGLGNYTETIPVVIDVDAAMGEHLMRIKTNRNEQVPNNACASVNQGETEDYRVLMGPVGLQENPLGNNDLLMLDLGDNHYELRFETDKLDTPLQLRMMDLQGRILMHNYVYSNGGVYSMPIDMSYAAAGPYLVRLGNERGSKIQRVIVR